MKSFNFKFIILAISIGFLGNAFGASSFNVLNKYKEAVSLAIEGDSTGGHIITTKTTPTTVTFSEDYSGKVKNFIVTTGTLKGNPKRYTIKNVTIPSNKKKLIINPTTFSFNISFE